MATALIKCLALGKRKRELMDETPARQRDSYVLINGFYECFLHKRNIAGSVPCGGFPRFPGLCGAWRDQSMYPAKHSVAPLLLGKHCAVPGTRHWLRQAHMTVGPGDQQAAADVQSTADFLFKVKALPTALATAPIIDHSFQQALTH
jgi:hypothetical protein